MEETAKTIFENHASGFEVKVLETFSLQYRGNPVYRNFVDNLPALSRKVKRIADIPFLPVSLFKSHFVVTGVFEPEAVFESSGTTGAVTSRHAVRSLELYRESFTRCFRNFYGNPSQWCIIGLLPSYLERGNSSLVFMVDELIRLSGHRESGFLLYQYPELHAQLLRMEALSQKTLLIGVGFALLDFAELFPMKLNYTTIMETGGMKGRREELTRNQLHGQLIEQLGVGQIHSEYGMTELLSQAYSKGGGLFHCPPWMKVILRAEDDPFSFTDSQGQPLKEGVINIIDLANRHSCAFIATDDLGRMHEDGSFEVLGRLDNSDIRGCSLLLSI